MNDKIKEIISDLQRVADRKCYPEDILCGSIAQEWIDYITDLQQENERLKNIINELERYLEDEKINLDDYLGCLDDEERHYEIVRLRPRYNDFKEIYDKLQELKGDSSNE